MTGRAAGTSPIATPPPLAETPTPPLPAAGVSGTPAQPPATSTTLTRWAWLVVLTVGLGLFEIVTRVLEATHNPNLLPSLILLGAVAVPAAFVTFIYGLRLDYDVDAATLMLVAFIGGVIGVVSASLIEYDTIQRLGTLPTLAVALAEETAKLLAPLAILLFTRHRRPSDGLLIGVACGAGFAAMETMGYSCVALVQSHQNPVAVGNLLLQRGFFSPATHMAWTGLSAAAIWHAAGDHWRPRAAALLALCFAAAVALHAAWDTASTTPAYVVIAAASLSLLAIAGHRLRRSQARPLTSVQTGGPWIRREQAGGSRPGSHEAVGVL